jgi:hypothetical protein
MESTNENNRIEIGQEGIGYLNITRKWTMFLAILGFIGLALMLIGVVAIGALLPLLGLGDASLGSLEITLMVVVLLLISALYFFPVLYLFRFSVHTKNAVETLSPEKLSQALKNLKSCFRFIGIFTIIIICLYILIFIFAGASAFLFNAS